MSTTIREQGIETVHDQVVSLVAQRWAQAFHCRVTIKTSLEQNPWADSNQQCDIVGWYVTSGGNSMEWMAEVETAETLVSLETKTRWRKAIIRGVPIYLLVPRGEKELAQKIAQEAEVSFTCIYEYSFLNDACHVL
ncbi:MAG TPA: hypothetical protein VEI50_13565 [Nitrospiraceae bacterium]|nr:hypothetical protein [Nitrospiraceae bacterium]